MNIQIQRINFKPNYMHTKHILFRYLLKLHVSCDENTNIITSTIQCLCCDTHNILRYSNIC